MKTILLAIAGLTLGSTAHAALSLHDFVITATAFSFSVTGTVDAGFTAGPNESDTVFIGSPVAPGAHWLGDSSAIVSYETNFSDATSSLYFTNGSFLGDFFGSDWFRFVTSTGTWTGGEVVDYTISGTGTFNLANLPESLKINQGWFDINNIMNGPNLGGGVAAVPEPSAVALLGLGTVGLIARRRRSA